MFGGNQTSVIIIQLHETWCNIVQHGVQKYGICWPNDVEHHCITCSAGFKVKGLFIVEVHLSS